MALQRQIAKIGPKLLEGDLHYVLVMRDRIKHGFGVHEVHVVVSQFQPRQSVFV